MFNEIYADLRTSYRNSWFKFLFQTTALGQFIAQEEAPNAWNFFNIYRSSWRLNRLWIRFFFKDSEDLKQFDNILRCLEVLEKAGIFSEDHCNQVAAHQNPHQLINILSFLSNRDCLDKEFFDLVVKNTLAHVLITSSTDQWVSIKRLMKAGILDIETFNQVQSFSNTKDLENELLRLEQANSLTKQNFLKCIHYPRSAKEVIPSNHSAHLTSMKLLMKAGILDIETFKQVQSFSNTKDLENELLRLDQAENLTKENFSTFIHSSCSAQVAPYSSLYSLTSP